MIEQRVPDGCLAEPSRTPGADDPDVEVLPWLVDGLMRYTVRCCAARVSVRLATAALLEQVTDTRDPDVPKWLRDAAWHVYRCRNSVEQGIAGWQL